MSNVATFSPSEIVIVFADNQITGYADGTFVEVERDEDTFTEQVGADGKVARAKNLNRMGIVRLTLQQTSPSNAILSAAQRLDESTGAGVYPVQVKHVKGTTLHGGREAWVRKPAASSYAKELGTREWEIRVADLDMTEGGQL